MKKITSLLIGASLALAGVAFAQPQTEESPAPGGKHQGKQKSELNQAPTGQGAETQRGGGKRGRGANANANATGGEPSAAAGTQTNAATGTEPGGKKGRKGRNADMNATGAETSATGAGAGMNADQMGGGKKGKHGKGAATAETGASTEAGASASAPMETGKKGKHGKGATTAETGASAAPGASVSAPMDAGKKGKHGKGMNAAASAAPATGATGASGAVGASGSMGASGATATTNTATTATTGGNAQIAEKNVGRGGKRIEQQKVQQIKQQHVSFKAQPKPNVAPAVTFNQNYRIQNVEQWQGPQYEVYRSYHPEWHDQGWYHSHYPRVELIAGGYYFFNNGYWYPAWGYDQGHAYYAYDAPIYVGHNSRPPDQVIADVQAVLQDMGYYTGEVDGLLGPLTRQALRDYQADHGLYVTEVIDEPTLDALQLS
jgi:hypothetical protein